MTKVDLYWIYMVNAIFNTGFALANLEAGWVNSAIQLWLVTLLLFIVRDRLR